jgi:hypothetical protein
VFGALWLVPAVGFVIASVVLLTNGTWLMPLLYASSLISLALITLDWSSAFAGGIVDVLIISALVVMSRVETLVSR